MSFKWNRLGVCTNQNDAVVWKNGNSGFTIHTAQAPDGTWRAAHDILFPGGWGGYWCRLKSEIYATEREAICGELRKVIARSDCPKAVETEARQVLANYYFVQQTLF